MSEFVLWTRSAKVRTETIVGTAPTKPTTTRQGLRKSQDGNASSQVTSRTVRVSFVSCFGRSCFQPSSHMHLVHVPHDLEGLVGSTPLPQNDCSQSGIRVNFLFRLF